VPVWQYRYFGDWDNTRLYPDSGAYHGSELQMIFGASEDVSGLPTSRDQRKTTRLMQKAWASFAQDPANGLNKKLHWPEFDPDSESLIRLAYENSPKADFVKPEVYDSPCSTITLGAFPSSA
jgi:cholinesterase